MRWNAASPLEELAGWYGIEPAYWDMSGRRRRASRESLLAALRAAGAPVATLAEVPEAVRARRHAFWTTLCEPVVVAWDGALTLELRLEASRHAAQACCAVEVEGGAVRRWTSPVSRLRPVRGGRSEGRRYVIRRWTITDRLPVGYHRFRLDVGDAAAEGLIMAAPTRASQGPPDARGAWGVFLPLYAARSSRNWGVGDVTDLRGLAEWTRRLGGRVVGTLPLLAGFLDAPCESSPYVPVSRRFWNELYLDVTALPEWRRDGGRVPGAPAREALEALRAAPRVEYGAVMRAKRQVLEALAQRVFAAPTDRRAEAFEAYRAAHPEVEDYARFRAVVERRRCGWPAWPEPLRDGVIRDGDYAPEAFRYHLYVQWAMAEQLSELSRALRAQGVGLYLDLPLGAHAAGYDTWRERDAFALEASAGAPPDLVFTTGQDWGMAPLHPERIRRQGYRYLIACLRAHLEHAGWLRIDHVMQLHRVFWIPRGCAVAEGVYVRARPEECYAMLSVESHRAGAVVVGEDLGTVPPEVRPSMARHGLHRLFVVEYELVPKRVPLRPPPPMAVASVNTHDMPPFAAYWDGQDLTQLQRLGLLPARAAAAEARRRARIRARVTAWLRGQGALRGGGGGAQEVLRGLLAVLRRSHARLLLVNLEDLWLETESQNVPGTNHETRNWCRKARYALEELDRVPELSAILQGLTGSPQEAPAP